MRLKNSSKRQQVIAGHLVPFLARVRVMVVIFTSQTQNDTKFSFLLLVPPPFEAKELDNKAQKHFFSYFENTNTSFPTM